MLFQQLFIYHNIKKSKIIEHNLLTLNKIVRQKCSLSIQIKYDNSVDSALRSIKQ